MKTIFNYTKFLVFSLVYLCLISSCAKDEFQQNLAPYSIVKMNATATANKEDVDQNLFIYSQKVLAHTRRLKLILNKYKNLKLDDKFFQSATACKNESSLEVILKGVGVSNPKELISILKEVSTIQNEFRELTPSFYQLSLDERNLKVSKALDNSWSSPSSIVGFSAPAQGGPTQCQNTYNLEMSRCDRDYFVCSGIAIATAGLTGGIGGGIVAVGCMISYHNCRGDASVDLNNCLNYLM